MIYNQQRKVESGLKRIFCKLDDEEVITLRRKRRKSEWEENMVQETKKFKKILKR